MSKMALIALAAMGLTGSAAAGSGSLTASDEEFLTKDTRGGAYELQSAKLAVQKASRSDVKSYAEKLVSDHQRYNLALEKLGKENGLALPTELDSADKSRLSDLEKLSGKAFDALYVKEALRINAEDKRDSEKEKATTKSEAIRSFIAKFADMDAEHETLARQLEKSSG